MQPCHSEEEREFSAESGEDDALDFDIEPSLEGLELDDDDVPDDATLERELGQSWRSGHPFREDA